MEPSQWIQYFCSLTMYMWYKRCYVLYLIVNTRIRLKPEIQIEVLSYSFDLKSKCLCCTANTNWPCCSNTFEGGCDTIIYFFPNNGVSYDHWPELDLESPQGSFQFKLIWCHVFQLSCCNFSSGKPCVQQFRPPPTAAIKQPTLGHPATWDLVS